MTLFATSFVSALPAIEQQNCEDFGAFADNCTVCVNGGSKNFGDAFQIGDTFNAGDSDWVYFKNDNPYSEVYKISLLNSNTRWYISNNLLEYTDYMTWQNSSRGPYFTFFEGTNTHYIGTKKGGGVRLEASTNNSSGTPADLRIEIRSNFRKALGDGDFGPLVSFNSCMFYSAAK